MAISKMAAPQSSNGVGAQNAAKPTKQANQPQATNKDGKIDTRGGYKSSFQKHKLRSADPLLNDSDTVRIQARLKSGGTAAEIAEEGYRVCRLNVALRGDLEEAKSELHSPLTDDNDAARIANRVNDGATTKDVAEEAYRVCRINDYLRKKANKTRAELREAKQKIAIKDDALSEMRPEYREMRTMLQRAWRLLQNKNVRIPEDMTKAYASMMSPDLHNWQPRKESKKATTTGKQDKNESQTKVKDTSKGNESKNDAKQQKKMEDQDKGKKKEDEKKSKSEKVNFLLHTQQGKTHDLAIPLADQDSEASDTEAEPEPAAGAEKLPSQRSKKRKGTSTGESVSKKRRIEDDSEDAEVEVVEKDLEPEPEAIPQPSKKRKGSAMEAPVAKKTRVNEHESKSELEEGEIGEGLEDGEIEE